MEGPFGDSIFNKLPPEQPKNAELKQLTEEFIRLEREIIELQKSQADKDTAHPDNKRLIAEKEDQQKKIAVRIASLERDLQEHKEAA